MNILAAIDWTKFQASATAALTALFALLTIFMGLAATFWKLWGAKIIAFIQTFHRMQQQQEITKVNIAAINEASPNTIPLVANIPVAVPPISNLASGVQSPLMQDKKPLQP